MTEDDLSSWTWSGEDEEVEEEEEVTVLEAVRGLADFHARALTADGLSDKGNSWYAVVAGRAASEMERRQLRRWLMVAITSVDGTRWHFLKYILKVVRNTWIMDNFLNYQEETWDGMLTMLRQKHILLAVEVMLAYMNWDMWLQDHVSRSSLVACGCGDYLADDFPEHGMHKVTHRDLAAMRAHTITHKIKCPVVKEVVDLLEGGVRPRAGFYSEHFFEVRDGEMCRYWQYNQIPLVWETVNPWTDDLFRQQLVAALAALDVDPVTKE